MERQAVDRLGEIALAQGEVSGGAGYQSWNNTVRVCPAASTRRNKALYSGSA